MSYFAILGDDPASFEVSRCHVNLWVLNGLGRRVFYMDIGIGMNVKAIPNNLAIALPMGVNPDDFKDLRKATEHDAKIIFGEPANVTDHVLNWGPGSENNPMHLSALKAARCGELSGDEYSVWSLNPVNWSLGNETYFRGRFRLTSLSRSWMRQRSGAILDLRLCDVRESLDATNLGGMDSRIVRIRKLNLFAILPASLKCTWVSPRPEHVRMLEGEAWSNYLGRQKKKLSRRKLAVYYWKSTDIDARKPFRAYLDLAEERAVLGWQPYAFVIVATAALLWVRELDLSRIVAGTKTWFAWVCALPALVLLGYLRRGIAALTSGIGSIDWVRKAFRTVEAWWFRPSD